MRGKPRIYRAACGARPASTEQVSGTSPPDRIRSGPRPRRCGACPTRGLAGEAACGASPASTGAACGASPYPQHAEQGTHPQARFRERRRLAASGRGHGPVGVGLAPHGALPGNAACGASPASTGAACGASPHPQHAEQASYLACGASPHPQHAEQPPHPQGRFLERHRLAVSGQGHGLVGVGLAPHGALPGKDACGASPASTDQASGASPPPSNTRAITSDSSSSENGLVM